MNARSVLTLVALSGCGPAFDSSLGDKARMLAAAVSSVAVPADVEQLASVHSSDAELDCVSLQLAAGTPCPPLSNTAARSFVVQRFEELGLAVSLETSDGPPSTSNVIAEVRGTELPDEVILIGAHYDAFYSGADDNSSGVAVMLEAARVVAASPLRRTVRFVGFDLEELGFGSSRLSSAAKHFKVALVLDTVAYRNTASGSQNSLPGFPLPSKADFIAAIANDFSRAQLDQLLFAAEQAPDTAKVFAGVAPGTGAGPLTGNLLRSDNAPFWFAGQSAIFLTDTANFRNANYHRPTDVFSSIDPEFLTQVARLTVASMAVWGDAP